MPKASLLSLRVLSIVDPSGNAVSFKMPLASDLIIDDSKFDMSQISSSTAALNDRLIETQLSIPKWYEVRTAVMFQKSHDSDETIR